MCVVFFQQLHGNFSWAPSRNQRLRPSGGAVPIPGSHPWGFLTDHGEWLSERANLVTLLYNSKKKMVHKEEWGLYETNLVTLYDALYQYKNIVHGFFFSQLISFPGPHIGKKHSNCTHHLCYLFLSYSAGRPKFRQFRTSQSFGCLEICYTYICLFIFIWKIGSKSNKNRIWELTNKIQTNIWSIGLDRPVNLGINQKSNKNIGSNGFHPWVWIPRVKLYAII